MEPHYDDLSETIELHPQELVVISATNSATESGPVVLPNIKGKSLHITWLKFSQPEVRTRKKNTMTIWGLSWGSGNPEKVALIFVVTWFLTISAMGTRPFVFRGCISSRCGIGGKISYIVHFVIL
ncbi:hypothetical protein G4B88_001817 [Cannabis sativa]|uniref:Uncharacterized protein n=1 Tax=Cannabis sativa TaxID=3483 RepID=A0A7J6I277_CANSA|nr:hypothetical protein G4B88_001817 [Cannabis sativa]